MPQFRIFYAVHQLGFKPNGDEGSFTEAHGVQSVGITTTFNLDQVFELGQICIYENIENIPDIEITTEKVLDGYPLVYLLATKGAPSATLSGRSVERTITALSVFPDTFDASSGTPLAQVQMSGIFVSALTYTFPVDGNSTESVTLVGNDKVWTVAPFASGAVVFTGAFDCTDEPQSIDGSGGVNRREDVIFTVPGAATLSTVGGVSIIDGDTTIVPPDIDGITASGSNEKDSGGNFGAHLQSISCSTDLGREALFELGRRGPYFRFVAFPTEVTSEFEIIGLTGDLVSATEEGVLGNGNNLRDRRIRIRNREGTRIDLGDKNKLATVTYGGGDAGGGNVTITYSFSTFNELTVTHPFDVSDGTAGTTDLRAPFSNADIE